MESSGSRFDILRFMVACEQFLAFVHWNGGPSALTHNNLLPHRRPRQWSVSRKREVPISLNTQLS